MWQGELRPRERDVDSPARRGSLSELAGLFLKLGTIAFGGPAAHIAMMEDEVVRRRRWLTRDQFLDYVGATNLIPGPNSTELAIHIGHARAGWPGLIVAGACFILPASLIVTAIAWAYVRFGTLPAVDGILYGVKPVVIAVVVQALWGLGRAAVKTPTLVALGLAALGATALGVHELLVLFAAGAGMALIRRGLPGIAPALVGFVPAGLAAAATPFGLWSLFGIFVKIGSVLFGSGYVLLAFLRAELVVRLGWLSETQLLDAVAAGQMTPGPLSATATFIGFVLRGLPGAAAATAGIFLPAFVFVALSGPLVPRLRRSPAAGAFLDGVQVASLALMAVVTWQLGVQAVRDVPAVVIGVASAVLLLHYRVNSSWLVLSGAAVGMALRLAGW